MKLTAEATDRAALAELWVSFVGVLRSYAAAASLGAPEHGIAVEQAGEHVSLRGARRTLGLQCTAGSGEGRWQVSGDSMQSSGMFALLLDGTLDWSGIAGRTEMDALAERLVTLVAE